MSHTELSLSVLFSNLVGLFALIGVGFAAVRAGLLPASASGPMTTLLMKITMPATIFVSMIRPFDPGFLRDALMIMGLGLLFHLGYVLLSWALVRPLRVSEGHRGMWMICCTFCNNGFMGFPIAYAIFGEEGLALAAMLGVEFNLVVYTLGIKLATMDRKEKGEAGASWGRVLFNVVNVTTVVGLLFYCLQLPVPQVVLTPIQHLSNVTTPLSMLVAGMNLAGSKVSDVLRDREAESASFIRLLVIPLLTWMVLRPLPIANHLVVGVILIIMAMPCPAASVVLGEQYGGCTELGARAVFLSSLLCVFTIPMIAMLL